MLEFQTILFLILLFALFAAVIIYFVTRKSQDNTLLVEWLKEMKSSVEKNSETLDRQLNNHRVAMTEQTKLIWERLDNASEVIRNVQKQIGGIQEFGTDIKDLSNILKSPKLRGGLGEQFLYEILANLLPSDLYKTQFKFKDGSICDAVVFIDKGKIPIDSKFPMENFKSMVTAETQELRDKFKKTFINDVKKRIDEIASKYILPEEGTTEQALMYIPSENVYYELIVNTPEIEDYAKNKSVIMVSPNTISYFLKVLLVAYKQNELQKHTGDILKALSGIRLEGEKFSEELNVLERHISTTYKSMDNVKIKFDKLFGKIESAQNLGEEKSSPLIED